MPSLLGWSRLPLQLSGGLDVLAVRAKFDVYNDPDASLVPLVQAGRRHLLHGMIQSPAGIPVAQYHLAGSRRIWIVVAGRHRHMLSLTLPSMFPHVP